MFMGLKDKLFSNNYVNLSPGSILSSEGLVGLVDGEFRFFNSFGKTLAFDLNSDKKIYCGQIEVDTGKYLNYFHKSYVCGNLVSLGILKKSTLRNAFLNLNLFDSFEKCSRGVGVTSLSLDEVLNYEYYVVTDLGSKLINFVYDKSVNIYDLQINSGIAVKKINVYV